TGESAVSEEARVGDNQQPDWTTRRRFTSTRVYVQPPWQFETELSWDTAYGRGDAPVHKLTQEIELGLPYRLQLEYEAAEVPEPHNDRYDSSSVELRWAIAEWGRIPLNPTVKVEWKINNAEADAYEVSLSVGDEL